MTGGEKRKGPTTKFLIEDNYYLIPEQYDFAIGRLIGIRKDGGDNIDFLSFHKTIEGALNWYYADKARRTAGEGRGTTIQDLLEDLIVEQKKTRETLEKLLRDLEVLR